MIIILYHLLSISLQKYFQSGSNAGQDSTLVVEWTNQHGCGGREGDDSHKLNCNLVLQYMVQDYDGTSQAGEQPSASGCNMGWSVSNPGWSVSNQDLQHWIECLQHWQQKSCAAQLIKLDLGTKLEKTGVFAQDIISENHFWFTSSPADSASYFY